MAYIMKNINVHEFLNELENLSKLKNAAFGTNSPSA